MQLIRTLGSWRPDASEYRNVTNVYRISLKSLARRYLELHDEIADLDVMIAAIVDELAPELIKRNAIGYESASQLLITAGDISTIKIRIRFCGTVWCQPCSRIFRKNESLST